VPVASLLPRSNIAGDDTLTLYHGDEQFLVSPPLKFRFDRVPIDVFKTNCSENDAVRYSELDHLQRPDASGHRSKVSYVPSESERIDLKECSAYW
jgi:hypothetical protein